MRKSRQQVRALRLALRHGDADAARLLLAHSTTLGHERLAIRRYFAARFLGAHDLDRFKSFCVAAARQIPAPALLAAARDAVRNPGQCADVHLIASELLPPGKPFLLPYEGTWPHLATDPRLCGRQVSVLGRVEIGARPWFGPGAVVRADGHFVQIGDDFRLGEMSTVHIAHKIHPTIVGERVTVGGNAVVHACTVGNDCLIEDGVVILDGANVADGVLVEAGSTVFPRSTLKVGLVYSGSPARPIREIGLDELRQRALLAHDRIAASLFAPTVNASCTTGSLGDDVFLATTASVSGRIEAGARCSVFFGCKLDAGQAVIAIGENSNIQDNTLIDASEGAVTIGENTTIGHNVRVRACSIGANALIGIGSNLNVGTIVEEDVLLAAGAATLPGQKLERGWVWGGRPARPIARLDDAKRATMSAIIEQYCAYGAAYRLAKDHLATKGGSNGTSSIADRHTNR